MPVPRGSLFGVPNENVKDKNEKHIQWDDDNLRENERTKSAKDIIDEPDTPWASPPPELFDSDAEEDEDVLEDEDLKNKRKTYAEEKIKERLERLEMTTRQSTGVAFVLETTKTTETMTVSYWCTRRITSTLDRMESRARGTIRTSSCTRKKPPLPRA